MKYLKYIFLSVLTFWLSACVTQSSLQMAGNDEDDYGIGGTGIIARHQGLGGTGIIGEITGFGSIFVNGLEIEPDANARILMDGIHLSRHDFAIGEVVQVLARDDKAFTSAQQINIRHEIIGPVSAIDRDGARAIIFDQSIQLKQGLSRTIQVGDYVAVSGFRDRQAVIHATAIHQSSKGGVLLRGRAEEIISTVKFQGLSLDQSQLVDSGDAQLVVHGRLEGQVLRIEHVMTDPVLPFTNLSNWIIQGFAENYALEWKNSNAFSALFRHQGPVIFKVQSTSGDEVNIKQLRPETLPKGNLMRISPQQSPANSTQHRSRTSTKSGR